MESLVIWYQNSLGSFMPKEVFIFLVSMLPLIELRGGLIIASLLKVPLMQANIICILGNILPIPFILLFIKKIFEFMKKHNGGQGDIDETWLILYRLEELQEINDDYEIEVFLPGHIIIGSNGGGELYGIDNKGNYFNVPVLIDEDDVSVLGTEIELLPDKINALWEQILLLVI